MNLQLEASLYGQAPRTSNRLISYQFLITSIQSKSVGFRNQWVAFLAFASPPKGVHHLRLASLHQRCRFPRFARQKMSLRATKGVASPALPASLHQRSLAKREAGFAWLKVSQKRASPALLPASPAWRDQRCRFAKAREGREARSSLRESDSCFEAKPHFQWSERNWRDFLVRKKKKELSNHYITQRRIEIHLFFHFAIKQNALWSLDYSISFHTRNSLLVTWCERVLYRGIDLKNRVAALLIKFKSNLTPSSGEKKVSVSRFFHQRCRFERPARSEQKTFLVSLRSHHQRFRFTFGEAKPLVMRVPHNITFHRN